MYLHDANTCCLKNRDDIAMHAMCLTYLMQPNRPPAPPRAGRAALGESAIAPFLASIGLPRKLTARLSNFHDQSASV